MPTRIRIFYRIIIAVRIKIQTVYRLRIKITRIIRRNKSTPFGIIISCIEVVELSLTIVIISSVSYGIDASNIGIRCAINDLAKSCLKFIIALPQDIYGQIIYVVNSIYCFDPAYALIDPRLCQGLYPSRVAVGGLLVSEGYAVRSVGIDVE